MGTTSSIANMQIEPEPLIPSESDLALSRMQFHPRQTPFPPADTNSECSSDICIQSRSKISPNFMGKTSRPSSSSSRRNAQKSVRDASKVTGRTSQSSSVTSLRKPSRRIAAEEQLPTNSSKEDLIFPETKDDVDAPMNDPAKKEQFFVVKTEYEPRKLENNEPRKLEEKTTRIPAKNAEDLKEAKRLIEQFPALKKIFSDFDSTAIMLSNPIELKELNPNWGDQLILVLQWPYFSVDTLLGKQALGDYLVRINMPQILYNFYGFLLQSLELEYWTETLLERNTNEPAAAVMYGMRGILWNYSDCSQLFAEHITSSGLFEYYVRDLEAMKEDISNPRKISFIFESAMGTIHNCLKNPANHYVFNKLDTVSHIIPYLKSDKPKIKALVLLTLAYIINEDQNELLLADKSIFRFLLTYVGRACESSERRFDGFSVNELVCGLVGLAKNDENKKLLMEIGSLRILLNIMKNGYDLEKKSAIECIWELSFNKENQKIILEDEEIVNILILLSQSENMGITRAANGALWVLNAEEREKQHEEDRKSKTQKKSAGHIMLSYAWTEQKKVIQVKEYLKRSNFNVWMDIDNMGGSTLQAMAEAVENSVVILVCMSERYKLSQNCRTEAEYAFSLKKEIIPLIMERGYQPDGWLGMIKGTRLFFDFSGKYPFETKIQHLIKELGSRGKPPLEAICMDAKVAVIKSAGLEAGKGATVAEWDSTDVKKWLKKNRLMSNNGLRSLSGEHLEFLQKLSHRAPEFYFGYLERKLGLNDLEEMMKFSKAVDQL